MHTLWGLTGPQFLVLYALLGLVALGIRVVFPLGVNARGLDLPNLLFMGLVGVGLVRLVNGLLLEHPVGILFVEVSMTTFLWGIAYMTREKTVRRKRFWLFLLIGAGVMLATLFGNPREFGAAASLTTMFLMMFPMGNTQTGGGGNGGCGGGCGGG